MASRVLVTGGASGIGAATCQLLRDDGIEVLAGDIAERADLHLDVSDEESWDRAVRDFGDFDGLVNCAGFRTLAPIVDMSEADFVRVMAVTLIGAFLGTRAAARAWAAAGHGGGIVNVSSVAGSHSPFPNRCSHVASKGGLNAFTRAAAVELAPAGIRVNAVAPGVIETPMAGSALASGALQPLIEGRIPLNRAGEPREIAAMIAFLLSERASYITGTVINVDGGMMAM